MWEENGILKQNIKADILAKMNEYLADVNWIGAVRILGSLTSWQYNSKSDLDVHVVVDWDALKAEYPGLSKTDLEEVVDTYKDAIRDQQWKVEGTSHPLEISFETPDKVATTSDGIYDLLNDTWEQEPRSVESDFDPEAIYSSIIDDAEAITQELDISIGDAKRDIQNIEALEEALQTMDALSRSKFQKRVQERMGELEQELVDIMEKAYDVSEERDEAYEPDSEENLTFKYLQKFGYIWLWKNLEKIMGEVDEQPELNPQDLSEIKNVIDEGWCEMDDKRAGKTGQKVPHGTSKSTKKVQKKVKAPRTARKVAKKASWALTKQAQEPGEPRKVDNEPHHIERGDKPVEPVKPAPPPQKPEAVKPPSRSPNLPPLTVMKADEPRTDSPAEPQRRGHAWQYDEEVENQVIQVLPDLVPDYLELDFTLYRPQITITHLDEDEGVVFGDVFVELINKETGQKDGEMRLSVSANVESGVNYEPEGPEAWSGLGDVDVAIEDMKVWSGLKKWSKISDHELGTMPMRPAENEGERAMPRLSSGIYEGIHEDVEQDSSSQRGTVGTQESTSDGLESSSTWTRKEDGTVRSLRESDLTNAPSRSRQAFRDSVDVPQVSSRSPQFGSEATQGASAKTSNTRTDNESQNTKAGKTSRFSGENKERTVLQVREPQLRNAPHGLQQPIGSDLDVSSVQSESVRRESLNTSIDSQAAISLQPVYVANRVLEMVTLEKLKGMDMEAIQHEIYTWLSRNQLKYTKEDVRKIHDQLAKQTGIEPPPPKEPKPEDVAGVGPQEKPILPPTPVEEITQQRPPEPTAPPEPEVPPEIVPGQEPVLKTPVEEPTARPVPKIIGKMMRVRNAAEPAQPQKVYTYALSYRPAGFATLPKGWIPKSTKPHADYKFGTVDFPRPLTKDEIEAYQLVPLDPNDPINLKKAKDERRQRLVETIDPEQGAVIAGLYPQPAVLSKDTRADGWRLTYFAEDGQPSGHEVFADIAEAIDFVAGFKDAKIVSVPKQVPPPTPPKTYGRMMMQKVGNRFVATMKIDTDKLWGEYARIVTTHPDWKTNGHDWIIAKANGHSDFNRLLELESSFPNDPRVVQIKRLATDPQEALLDIACKVLGCHVDAGQTPFLNEKQAMSVASQFASTNGGDVPDIYGLMVSWLWVKPAAMHAHTDTEPEKSGLDKDVQPAARDRDKLEDPVEYGTQDVFPKAGAPEPDIATNAAQLVKDLLKLGNLNEDEIAEDLMSQFKLSEVQAFDIIDDAMTSK